MINSAEENNMRIKVEAALQSAIEQYEDALRELGKGNYQAALDYARHGFSQSGIARVALTDWVNR
jgi:hypothetical protein